MRDRKPVDPALREYLDQQAANAPNLTEMPDGERVQAVRAAQLLALKGREAIPGLPNCVDRRDLTVGNGRPARLYSPGAEHDPAAAQQPKALLVYLHGGGWVAGSLETHDPFCCLLAEAAEVLVLSVDYRQPPENRFPGAVDDAVAAVRWASEHAAELGADGNRLALGGDSAGGNLTAVTTNLLATMPDAPQLAAQVLLFPVTDHPSAAHPSYEENATGFGLTAEGMRWFWQQYAPGVVPGDPKASPLQTPQLPKLPLTLVTTAEYDVLRDEGIAYAEKLRAAQVIVTHLHAPDMSHNFPVSPGTVARFPQSREFLSEIAGWLRAALKVPLPGSLAR